MSKNVFVVTGLVFAASLAISEDCRAEENVAAFERDLLNATVLLSSIDKDGNMRMCTATAFEREGKKYRFLTVAHCVSKEGKPVEGDWLMFFGDAKKNDVVFAKFLTIDAKYKVNPKNKDDGFAVFEAEFKDETAPVILIASRDALLGEEVSGVSFPHIRPKQLFRGYVCGENQDFEFFGSNFKDFVFFQLYGAPGSSGAAIVSHEDGTIVAIVQGGDAPEGGVAVTGLAISNFKKFWTEFKNKPKPKAK